MSTVLPAGSQVKALPLDGWVKIQFPKAGLRNERLQCSHGLGHPQSVQHYRKVPSKESTTLENSEHF